MLLLSHLTNKAEQAFLKFSTCLYFCVLELLESLTERNEEILGLFSIINLVNVFFGKASVSPPNLTYVRVLFK